MTKRKENENKGAKVKKIYVLEQRSFKNGNWS